MLSSGIGKHTCSLSASSVSHSVVRGFFQVQCFPALLPEENTHPLSHSLSHWCKSLSDEKRYYWHFRSLLAGRPHLSVSDTRERMRLRKTKRIWRERDTIGMFIRGMTLHSAMKLSLKTSKGLNICAVLAKSVQCVKQPKTILFNCILKRVKEMGGETIVRIRPCGCRLNKTSWRGKQTARHLFFLL